MYHGLIILQAAWRAERRHAEMARCSEPTKGWGCGEASYKF